MTALVMMRPLFARLGFTAMILLGGVAGLNACSVCSLVTGDGFELPNPQALDVAVATGKAVAAGLLPVSPKAAGDSQFALSTAPVGLLCRLWVLKQKPFGGDPPPVIHVVLVDDPSRCAVKFGPGGLQISPDTSGSSDWCVVTTRRAMIALIEGQLTFEQERSLAILILDKVPAQAGLTFVPHPKRHSA